jgi:hypothetical protein
MNAKEMFERYGIHELLLTPDQIGRLIDLLYEHNKDEVWGDEDASLLSILEEVFYGGNLRIKAMEDPELLPPQDDTGKLDE